MLSLKIRVYLHSTFCFRGSGTESTVIPLWNPGAEESVFATAMKLDASNRNLTVEVGYGFGLQTNSTNAPKGTTKTFIAIAP